MKFNYRNVFGKPTKYNVKNLLYMASSVVALLGIALLIINIYFYIMTVRQYIAQGYTASAVIGNLIPSQLIPGIFEPIALYGGIAIVIYGVAKINKGDTEYMTDGNIIIKENIPVQENDIQNIGMDEQIDNDK